MNENRPSDFGRIVTIGRRANTLASIRLIGVLLGVVGLSYAAPNVTATKSHSPAGPFHLGNTITYSTTINNAGTDATGVNFSTRLMPTRRW